MMAFFYNKYQQAVVVLQSAIALSSINLFTATGGELFTGQLLSLQNMLVSWPSGVNTGSLTRTPWPRYSGKHNHLSHVGKGITKA